MTNFIRVAKVPDIPAGSMKTVMVSGKRIALTNIDGEYFAVDDTCSHAQCSLGGEGFLDGNVITCGCHGAQFDATSGGVLALPATAALTSYQVKVEGDDVMIAV